MPSSSWRSVPRWPRSSTANAFPLAIAHCKWLLFADSNWYWMAFDFADPGDYQAHLNAAGYAPVRNAASQIFAPSGGVCPRP